MSGASAPAVAAAASAPAAVAAAAVAAAAAAALALHSAPSLPPAALRPQPPTPDEGDATRAQDRSILPDIAAAATRSIGIGVAAAAAGGGHHGPPRRSAADALRDGRAALLAPALVLPARMSLLPALTALIARAAAEGAPRIDWRAAPAAIAAAARRWAVPPSALPLVHSALRLFEAAAAASLSAATEIARQLALTLPVGLLGGGAGGAGGAGGVGGAGGEGAPAPAPRIGALVWLVNACLFALPPMLLEAEVGGGAQHASSLSGDAAAASPSPAAASPALATGQGRLLAASLTFRLLRTLVARSRGLAIDLCEGSASAASGHAGGGLGDGAAPRPSSLSAVSLDALLQ
jgi:hypothetical protein